MRLQCCSETVTYKCYCLAVVSGVLMRVACCSALPAGRGSNAMHSDGSSKFHPTTQSRLPTDLLDSSTASGKNWSWFHEARTHD